MKQKNYEKRTLVILLIIVLLVIESIFIFSLSNLKVIEYKSYSMIMINKEEGLIVLDKKDKQIIHKNRYFYYQNKKYKYQIDSINKTNDYIEVKILFKKIKEKKENDIITISIESKRINMLEVIKNIWGGDSNS